MGVGCVPYPPQAKGRLTRPGARRPIGRPSMWVAKSFDLDVDQLVVDPVQRVAESRGIPMSKVALAWLLAKPVVSAPIIGATKPHHLADAAAAITLTVDEIRQLEELYTPQALNWR
jgi:1-deoxyxylulose-5-phosphate synthase